MCVRARALACVHGLRSVYACVHMRACVRARARARACESACAAHGRPCPSRRRSGRRPRAGGRSPAQAASGKLLASETLLVSFHGPAQAEGLLAERRRMRGGGCQPRHLYAARAGRRGRLGTATASDAMTLRSRFQPRRLIPAGHQCSHRRRRHPRHEHGSDSGESASASACARTRTGARASPPASPLDAFAAPGLSRRGASAAPRPARHSRASNSQRDAER